MKTLLVAAIAIASVFITDSQKRDFFSNLEEITSPPPESLSALLACGEGEQKDKFACVPYYNCDPDTNTIVAYPQVDGSAAIIPKKRPFECGQLLQVCCQIPNSTVLPLQHVPTIDLEFQLECGKTKANSTKDSNYAAFAEFPWMVAIFETKKENSEIMCGGSLLSPVVVLTAAHCVRDFKPNEIKIRAGEWNIEANTEKIPHQERNVSKIIIHEHHMRSTLYNDVALLILNSSLSQADNIGSICLPSDEKDFDSTDCLVTGWGKRSLDKNKKYFSKFLEKTELFLIPNNECQWKLREKVGEEFILENSFICAFEESEIDACVGDGGGPLICPDSKTHNRFYQVGIVSWGLGCGDYLIPGVYANVTQYKSWIDNKLVELGYNSRSYTDN